MLAPVVVSGRGQQANKRWPFQNAIANEETGFMCTRKQFENKAMQHGRSQGPSAKGC